MVVEHTNLQHQFLRRRARPGAAAVGGPARAAGQSAALAGPGSGSVRRYTGTELYKETLGVVGLGRDAVLVAPAPVPRSGMRVLALRPVRLPPRAPASWACAYVPLDELLAGQRLHQRICLGYPGHGGPDRRGAAEARSSRRRWGVNAARGGIVDEDALYAALPAMAASPAPAWTSTPRREEPCTDSPALRPGQRGGDPTPAARPPTRRRTPGRRRRSRIRPAGAGQRAGSGRRQRLRRCHRRGGAARGSELAEKLGRVFTALRRRRADPSSTSRCAARSPSSTSARSPSTA